MMAEGREALAMAGYKHPRKAMRLLRAAGSEPTGSASLQKIHLVDGAGSRVDPQRADLKGL